MITKLIFPDSFDFGMPTASMMEVYSGGVDKGYIRKRAAMFDADRDAFEHKPDHSYIHMITVGALERYGANNNGDSFNKTAGSNRAVCPGKGCREVESLDGGLLKYHNDMFEKHASVYKNHKNKHKGGKASGYIVKAAYNDDMDRGELIIGVDTDKWSDELQKIARQEPIYFSMGCDTPADCCSYCNNRAHTREEYCQHLKEAMLSIDSRGNQVSAITDTPYFHDISKVFKPADKICFALRKVASNEVISSAELAEIYGMTPSLALVDKYMGKHAADRLALVRKLAEIEKEILLSSADSPCKAQLDAFGGKSDDDGKAVERLSKEPTGAAMGALKNNLVVLPMDVFFKLILGDKYPEVEPMMPDAKNSLPGIFGRMLEDPGLGEMLGNGDYECCPSCDKSLKKDAGALVPAYSIAEMPVRSRIISAVLRADTSGRGKRTIVKQGSAGHRRQSEYLTREYGRYLVAFADGLPDRCLNLTVAQTLAISNQ